MNAKHACKLLALSLAFAGNLAQAHGGHDHNGHAEQRRRRARKRPACALPMSRC